MIVGVSGAKMVVGVIGNGFVGSAIADFFGKFCDVRIYDIDPERSTHSIKDIAKAGVVFVCVPTPTDGSGVQHLEALDQALGNLDVLDFSGIAVIKSTVLPGTCRKREEKFGLKIVFWPEFLTQRTAKQDFAEQKQGIFLGGLPEDTGRVADFLSISWPSKSIHTMRWEQAEMIKYVRNTFYALKVAHFNEISRLCQALDLDYSAVQAHAVRGAWIDPMHTYVPGPDGRLGFGGACLPKDSAALARYAREMDAPLDILEEALMSNARFRR